MNNSFKIAVVAAWFGVLSIASGWAQNSSVTAKEEPPKAPYIASLPKFAHYEIRIEGAKGVGKTGGLVAEGITKLGDAKGIVELFGDGKKKELWVCHGMILSKLSAASSVGVYDPKLVPADVPLSGDDFTGFEWLAANNYSGVVTFEGNKCYLFEKSEKRALIDMTTKFPLLLKQGDILNRFQYGPMPPETTKMPPEFQKKWDQYSGELKSITGKSDAR